MPEPSEKDMQAAADILGCSGLSCRVRPTFAIETGEPDGGSYMHHESGCPALYREDVARALAAAREEGRREMMEGACKALCSKCRRGLVYQRFMGGENFGHFEQRGDVDHWAGNCDATAIRALLSSPAPTEPAPTTEPTRCLACDGIGAVNASEAAPMGEECPRCLGDGVAPSQEKP